MWRRTSSLGALWLCLAAAGCGDEAALPPPAQAPDLEALLDLPDEIEVDLGDLGAQDEEDAADAPELPPPGEAGFGEPCRSNLDCESGFCISSPRGFVCTQSCGEDSDCPALGDDAMLCRLTENFGADGVRICVADASSLCQPCFNDGNCFGGACVDTGDGRMICGRDCGEGAAPCPSGSACQIFAPGGGELAVPQCLPLNLACDCAAQNAGQQRPCVRLEEGSGARCFGVETCDPARGWLGCDAPFPAPEVCDGQDNNCNGIDDDGLPVSRPCERSNEHGACAGIERCQGAQGWACQAPEPAPEACDLRDNDCDGQIDEPFRDDQGRYLDPDHCGACNNRCADRLPSAAQTDCALVDDQPRCVITACPPGTTQAGPTTCLPLASRLCQPCDGDAQCNQEVGDRCLQYDSGQGFCGRDCAEDSPFGAACPVGYVCDPLQSQCRLERGDCLCGPGENFLLPCTITAPDDPARRCVGALRCEDGALSSCEPPEDVCNGYDDDCDGDVDGALFDDARGAWLTDTHCGRCYNDCVARTADPALHAQGFCDAEAALALGETPDCGLRCDEGWVNVNGVLSDGCECQRLTPGADEPDRDGIDSDCDGIDGQIARGWFVSPTGDDAAAGTRAAPLRTLQAAIDRAGGARDHVYVAAGVYDESIVLRAGVSVFGGYNADWSRRSPGANETALFGRAPSPERPATVTGRALQSGAVTVSGFTIVGYDNTAPSGNSVTVSLVDCDASVTLRDNVIRGGRGGNGLRGDAGQPGATATDNATQGEPQRAASALFCANAPNNRSAGGAGATHTCLTPQGAQVSTQGGVGGFADCPNFNQPEAAGGSGGGGNAGGGGFGGYNQYLDENCAVCIVPDNPLATEVGVPGASGQNGALGAPARGCAGGAGALVGEQWRPGRARLNPGDLTEPDGGRGGDGLRGSPGGGGGGGGAGSGVQRLNRYFVNCPFFEVIGGGGGGGGAGGCGGEGGAGGQHGGGSLTVLIAFTQPPATLPALRDNRVERGIGGIGGDGGAGAVGGDGSTGRDALALTPDQQAGLLVCADPGGRGGDGGDGGPGGGGGGGCGGISAGVYVWGHNGADTSALRAGNTFPNTGSPGPGGRGGASPGQSGADGADGLYQEVVQ